MSVKRLFVALFLIALYTMAVRETLDPDMWWHLRTGETILNEGLPRQDVFSFTAPDHEWITHEWLSQVLMWGVYAAAGLPGLIVVYAALIALTFGLLYLACPGRPYLAGFVVLLAAIASAVVWGARPQIFNLLFTAVFVLIVERVRNRQFSPRTLWLLPLLMVMWANLHSGYLLGVVLLGTYAVGEAVQCWLAQPGENTLSRPTIRRLFLITGLSFLAAGLNANGPELWIYPFFTLGSNAMQAYIQEWHSPDFHQTHFWPFATMLGTAALGWIVSDERPSFTDFLLVLGTGAAGLLSARNIPLFAIIAAPVVARHWQAAASKTRFYPLLSSEGMIGQPTNLMKVLNIALLVLGLSAAVAWTATKIANNEAEIRERYPVAAVDYLQESGLAEARGYNSYNWGGYLIWRRLPVFVDGRADVYGDEFLFFYRQAFEVQADWAEPLAEYDVQYVLMERETPLTAVLAASDGWEEAYRDDIAQIFIRSR